MESCPGYTSNFIRPLTCSPEPDENSIEPETNEGKSNLMWSTLLSSIRCERSADCDNLFSKSEPKWQMLCFDAFFWPIYARSNVILAPWYDLTFSFVISASPPVNHLRAASIASVEPTPLEVAFQVMLCTATVVA